jgi:ubiquitin carboxyl-terminal hydrolase 4/11
MDDMDVDSGMGDDKLSSSPSSAVEGTRIMASRKRFASGLANMGNTCFMNSMLQCLAHTESLRRYFLSGEYENDLNRDNPLGTGGDLATQFAYLLSEMWGVPTKRRTVMGTTEYNYPTSSTTAVYPRSFKYTLGKHAEQFSGYDQHDSQELATYLLDALHEDTNRVTKKPYVEKPEQGEDEPDEVAAMKAWRLHLQRDDSKVLENFMGQVKSRVQCSEEGCNRVSTTFDPFMYLSVPIPGATERTMKVTFVPLDPMQRMKNVNITIAKTASISKLMGKLNEQLVQCKERDQPIPLTDLCAVDVWSHSVFKWFTGDHDIDGIRESDTTFIFELRPLSEFQEAAKQKENSTEDDLSTVDNKAKCRPHRFKLDLVTMTKLNKQDEWKVVLENYVQQPSMLYSMFNPNRGAIEERKKFQQKLENFIDLLNKETAEEEESTGLKRSREDSEDFGSKSEVNTPFATDEPVQSIIDRTDASSTFKNVKSKQDIAVLEFCAGKLRQFIQKMIKDKGAKFKDGILIQIVMQRPSGTAGVSNKDYTFASPVVLRIPDTMTVYGLREELARRLSRSLRPGHPPTSTYENGTSGESSSEATDKDDVMQTQDQPFGSPAHLLLRRIPLSYACKGRNAGNKQIGVLERAGNQNTEGVRPVSLASSSDEAEQKLVGDLVGPNETVNLDWPANWCDTFLDVSEYDAADDVKGPEETDGEAQTQLASKNTSVIDCIDKYCQMEQLEETEMWYCSRCQKHVRAWKQFHLYRAPPILIVHLKRFQYSATTHRRDKISAMIDFPLVGLDLTNQVSHWAEHEDPIYDCYAVSNHYGGLGGGHYTAYILSDDGTWCHYDDSRVTNNIDPSEVQSEAAYVLYYRRRDVPVGQDSICDGQTPDTVSQIISDQPETARDSSEISSNNTANAGDDDMIVEDTDANSVSSSRTCPSPMGSTDGGEETYDVPDGRVDKMRARGNPNFPLQ